MMKKILVCRGGALGDLLLTFSVLRRLRDAFEESRIVLAAYLPQARLAEAGGFVDELVSLDGAGAAEWFAPGEQLPAEAAAFFRSFDLVVCFLHDPGGRLAARLRNAGVGKLVMCSPLVTQGHATDHFMAALAVIGLTAGQEAAVRLQLPAPLIEQGRERVSRLGRRVVALHPGSGSPRKNWPLERFVRVAEALRTGHATQPAFLLGDAEAGMEDRLALMAPGMPRLQGLDLLELAGVLNQCCGYVGNDSGVTHLAAALGIPVVAIFGPTDPAMWAPRGEHVRVMRAETSAPDEIARSFVRMEPAVGLEPATC